MSNCYRVAGDHGAARGCGSLPGIWKSHHRNRYCRLLYLCERRCAPGAHLGGLNLNSGMLMPIKHLMIAACGRRPAAAMNLMRSRHVPVLWHLWRVVDATTSLVRVCTGLWLAAAVVVQLSAGYGRRRVCLRLVAKASRRPSCGKFCAGALLCSLYLLRCRNPAKPRMCIVLLRCSARLGAGHSVFCVQVAIDEDVPRFSVTTPPPACIHSQCMHWCECRL